MLAGRLLAGFAAAGYAPSIQIFVAEITEVGQQFMFLFSYCTKSVQVLYFSPKSTYVV